jgi:HTH-type transcriptional repressor of NAD biosynthesis genes
MIIALLGGESTGKSTLSLALRAALADQCSGQIVLVDEYLRQWCSAKQRAPRQEEQAAIAGVQRQRIIEALKTGGRDHIVIADTTPMMVAAYSEQYFGDTSLWDTAVAFQRQCDVTLLMGLDLPWISDGLFRDSPQAREKTDALLRAQLEQAGLAFHTVYGSDDLRVQNALRIVLPMLGRQSRAPDEALEQGRLGAWQCEACSDPDCEHRLFTALLKTRGTTPKS